MISSTAGSPCPLSSSRRASVQVVGIGAPFGRLSTRRHGPAGSTATIRPHWSEGVGHDQCRRTRHRPDAGDAALPGRGHVGAPVAVGGATVPVRRGADAADVVHPLCAMDPPRSAPRARTAPSGWSTRRSCSRATSASTSTTTSTRSCTPHRCASGPCGWAPGAARGCSRFSRYLAWVAESSLSNAHYYCAYPSATTTEVVSALAVRDAMAPVRGRCPRRRPRGQFAAAWRTALTGTQRHL